ncbi:MAG: polysaccharide biosynthesis/export family protein [Methyloligellaceae bacterium]
MASTAFAVASIGTALGGEPLQPPLPEAQASQVETGRHSKAEDGPAKPGPSAAGYAFGPGDRLKVTFYERSDLSGEFRVRSDGRISLPVIGAIMVEGKNLAQLESDIAGAFFTATKRSAYVNVEVVERRPFYVVGFVNKPGAYPFVPDMTVVHALAIAGGVFRTTGTTSNNIDLSRETWRRKQALDALKRALSRRARLEAERDGLETVKAPDRLVRLAGREHADVAMASEKRIHDQNRKALKQRLAGLLRVEKLAQEEIKAQRARLESMREQEKLRRAELKDTEQLANRGLTRRDLIYSRKYGISALKGEASEVTAEIARAERTLAQARRDRTMLGVETRTSAQREITLVEKEIESFEHAMKASQDAMQLIGGVPMDAATSQLSFAAVTYEIMRRQGGRYEITPAAAASLLHPCDVLRVSRMSPAVARNNDGPMQTGTPTVAATGQARGEAIKQRPDLRQARKPARAEPGPGAGPQEIIVKLRETLSALETLKQRLAHAEEERRQIIELMKAWRARALDMNRRLTALDAVWREASQLLKKANTKPEQAAAPRKTDDPEKTDEPQKTDDPKKTDDKKASALPADPTDRALSLRALALETPQTRQERILIARVLQTELKRVGCYVGRIDGIWGRRSVSALSRFSTQTDHSLSANQPSGTALRAVLDVDSRVCLERGTP